jgi:2-haloacid dehalogenase
MEYGRYDALTFDCYGTLIDWEAGILGQLRPMLIAHGVAVPADDDILAHFGRLEREAESGAFRPYRSILTDVAFAFGAAQGFEATAGEAERFAASVETWPPFPDSVESLAKLSTRYRLGIVSNVDDDLFAGSAAQLGVDFSEVVTAQQVRSYKPGFAHFHEVWERLGLPKEKVLHVAQSRYHDISPAVALDLDCVWVNRRGDRDSGGATTPSDAAPDHEVPDLGTLVEEMGL